MAFIPRTDVNVPTDMKSPASPGYRWYNSHENPYNPNYGLPNCPCYCYGRVAEIQNAWNTNLPSADAKDWYGVLAPIYGSLVKPIQGCLICYGPPQGSTAPGHVSVVEEVYADGSVLTSNSGYTRDPALMDRYYFWTAVVKPSEGYKESWMNDANRQYSVQGFIYPYQTPTPTQYQWHAMNSIDGYGFATESQEAYENCMLMLQILYSYGFSAAAAAGVCGNVMQESAYNPWSWQDRNVLSSTDTYLIANSTVNGYGLYGFTPSGKYLLHDYSHKYSTFSPHYSDIMGNAYDGDAQTRYMADQLDPDVQWQLWRVIANSGRSITFDEYKQMTDPRDAAYIFMIGFEGPDHAGANLSGRQAAAEYWYGIFSGITPGPPPPQPPTPTPTPSLFTKMPIWMYLKRRKY